MKLVNHDGHHIVGLRHGFRQRGEVGHFGVDDVGGQHDGQIGSAHFVEVFGHGNARHQLHDGEESGQAHGRQFGQHLLQMGHCLVALLGAGQELSVQIERQQRVGHFAQKVLQEPTGNVGVAEVTGNDALFHLAEALLELGRRG